MFKHTLLLAVGLAVAWVPLAQGKIAKDRAKAMVVFTAKGTAGMTIVGTTSALVLQDDGKILLLSVPLGTITTGIALRDKHMREKYLHVAQYPSAELAVDRSTLRPPGSSAVTADAKGLMKLHGKSKTVFFRYSAKRSGQAIRVTQLYAARPPRLRDPGAVVSRRHREAGN